MPTSTAAHGPSAAINTSTSHISANAAKDKDAAKKRGRYTTIACNECKRRKIKCNGEKPCERCGNQDLSCVYDSPNFQDSDEYRRMCTEIETLQSQVRELFGLVAEMKAEGERDSLREVSQCERTILSGEAGPTTVDLAAREPESDIGMGGTGTAIGVIDATGYGGDAAAAIAAAAGNGRMQVDMSRHDGRIDFIHDVHTRAQDLGCSDPLTTINLTCAKNLMSVYTQQVHPIYPFLELPDVLGWLEKSSTFLPEAYSDVSRQSEDHMEVSQSTDEALRWVEAITCKMTLAIAAHTQNADSELAQRLYANVQKMYTTQDVPLGYKPSQHGGLEEVCMRPPWQAMIKGMRLRLLEALWQFQHGNAEAAHTATRETMLVYKSLTLDISNHPEPNSEGAAVCLKLGASIYSMYWRWTLLTKPSPRYDPVLEKLPPKHFIDGDEYEKEDDSPVRIAFFELAKLCSITCFAFERPYPELVALKDTKPTWGRESSVEYVHRWQGGFPFGLRSLAVVRPEFLKSKSVEERITLSAVYLHAHHLRISACWYKRAAAADRYNGPISELYDSAKWARESIDVLWSVHEVGETWVAHAFLYNNFLLVFGSWVYDLMNGGVVRLTNEVKVSLQKTLVLMETYCQYWDGCRELLGKLQDSRKYGAFA